MTTDLRIKGSEYDLEATFSNPPINVLIYMQQRLRITMKEIVGGLENMNIALTAAQTERDAGADDAPSDAAALLDVLYNEESLRAFQGLIWLARTCAGERVDGKFFTLEEGAEGIGVADIEFLNETPSDPTELEVAASPSSSTTSSEMSMTTSSSSPTSGPDTRS